MKKFGSGKFTYRNEANKCEMLMQRISKLQFKMQIVFMKACGIGCKGKYRNWFYDCQ